MHSDVGAAKDYPEDADLYGMMVNAANATDPIATYHANREAKAQRVAEEGWGGAPALDPDEQMVVTRRELRMLVRLASYEGGDLTVATHVAGYEDDVVDRALKMARWIPIVAEPTDDIPTLPPTALRTWEGWGG